VSEELFRLLEIIAILLPLTGIFIQLSFRFTEELEGDDHDNDITLIRLLLLTAGAVLGLAGSIVSAVLSLTIPGVWVSVALGLMYISFLVVTGVLGILWAWVHPEIAVPAEQQTLSESAPNTSDEE
jgi:hypothetical protein